MKRLGPQTKTQRGFKMVHFKDHYGEECSLQASSLAIYAQPGISAVWLGVDDPKPKVMNRDAIAVGVQPNSATGWRDYPIPKEVSLYTRMHLNRKQVAALIRHLQAWLDTGSFVVK